MDTAINALNNWGQISNEELYTVHKVPTHGEYLIENNSIGPPVTQKIGLTAVITVVVNAGFDT